MGLGSVLKMGIDGVPSKLAFFVVDKLNTRDMQLDVKTGSIAITVEYVHDLLGLPIGGIDLINSEDRDFGLKLTKEWRRQFQKLNIRPTDIRRKIFQTNESDFMFKMNFLVLFVNLMADCNTMGSCNLSLISKLKNEEMINQIDWSKYIYDRLKTSKEKWKMDNDLCFYAGPLTYLTISDETVTKFKTGFEKLFVTVENHTKESKEDAVDEGKGKSNPMAIIVYEQVDDIKEFDACWECPQFVEAVTEKVELEVQKSEIRKSMSNSLSSEGGIEALGFDLGISPEKKESRSNTVQSKVSGPHSVLRHSSSEQTRDKGKRAVTFSLIPMTSYFDDSEEAQRDDKPFENNNRGCSRLVNPGEHLRSPFVKRCVDFNVSSEEKRIHEWASAAFGDTL
ncbi:hypothetical protein L6452_31784 [Arctium lappa]|uniref:Uncharacterized protein n=1 Tax=Arctium lappa TaxID=4217 RepID=A0ACB8Z3W9_ARCLA|nr:hypothetical protein L6452_31784 [Arctium lappa]